MPRWPADFKRQGIDLYSLVSVHGGIGVVVGWESAPQKGLVVIFRSVNLKSYEVDRHDQWAYPEDVSPAGISMVGALALKTYNPKTNRMESAETTTSKNIPAYVPGKTVLVRQTRKKGKEDWPWSAMNVDELIDKVVAGEEPEKVLAETDYYSDRVGSSQGPRAPTKGMLASEFGGKLRKLKTSRGYFNVVIDDVEAWTGKRHRMEVEWDLTAADPREGIPPGLMIAVDGKRYWYNFTDSVSDWGDIHSLWDSLTDGSPIDRRDWSTS